MRFSNYGKYQIVENDDTYVVGYIDIEKCTFHQTEERVPLSTEKLDKISKQMKWLSGQKFILNGKDECIGAIDLKSGHFIQRDKNVILTVEEMEEILVRMRKIKDDPDEETLKRKADLERYGWVFVRDKESNNYLSVLLDKNRWGTGKTLKECLDDVSLKLKSEEKENIQ